MPHALFPTAFGTCGLAWNEAGLTGFQLPEATEALTEKRLGSKARTTRANGVAPDWVQGIITRVQQHFEGKLHDFSDAPIDWSRVSQFQQAVYRQTQTTKPGCKRSYGEIAKALSLGPGAARDTEGTKAGNA